MLKELCLFHSRIKQSHQNEYNIPNFPHSNPWGRGEIMVYPKNQVNSNFKKKIIVNPIYKSSSKDILTN